MLLSGTQDLPILPLPLLGIVLAVSACPCLPEGWSSFVQISWLVFQYPSQNAGT